MVDSGPDGNDVGTRSAPRPRSAASGCGAVIMILVGAILLLPGLCSLGFMAVAITAGPGDFLKDPSFAFIWLIGLAIAAGGVWLIVAAVRGDRHSRPP